MASKKWRSIDLLQMPG
ncbi:hypothetical protein OYC64_014863 [Pagothenia borchgrevinki]|uniref:Uncharacterized protein n=1 Tax=Pagothenia borchgrevinki TaxID=8213 RepID=A0ABD2H2T2_PAGBO